MRYTTSSTLGCCAVDQNQKIGCYAAGSTGKESLIRCSYSHRRFTVATVTKTTAVTSATSSATTTPDIFRALRETESSTTCCGIVPTKPIKQSLSLKKVRFADDEGGLLCSVKIFEEKPCFAYQPRLHTTPAFSKTNLTNYKTVYNETKLSLKNVSVVAYGLVNGSTLFGAIAVRNLAFNKKVSVRLTLDGWRTPPLDLQAKFVQQEFNGLIDRFFFMKPLTDDQQFEEIARDIEFAVCYTVNDTEHWDNNGGANYKFVSNNTDNRNIITKSTPNV